MSDSADVLPFKPRDPQPVHDTSYEVALDDARGRDGCPG